MMHAARLADSPRLQRVHKLLSDGCDHSTKEIITVADVCSPNSCVAELRQNGLQICCRVTIDSNGKRIWLYRMHLEVAAE